MLKSTIKTLLISFTTTILSFSNSIYAEEIENISMKVIDSDNSQLSRTNSIISKHNIIGENEVTPDAFKRFFDDMAKKMNFKYKLNCSINEFIDIVYEEAAMENVRADIVIAQAIEETGYFQFKGIVKSSDNNFSGLGATGALGVRAKFSSPRIGVRAQVQHLKAYASKDNLVQSCVDPRFKYVTRGSAKTVEDLAGKWAIPGYDKNKYSSLKKAMEANDSYGQKIYKILEKAKSYNSTLDAMPVYPNISTESEDNSAIETKIKGKVTSNSLNMRKGAGTKYSVICKLKKNTKVNILSQKDNWYNIQLSNNKTGWVHKNYILLESNSFTETYKKGVVTVSSLNVRKGAGTKYSIIDKLKKNSKVNIVSLNGNWFKIKLSSNKIGWVHKNYVKYTS